MNSTQFKKQDIAFNNFWDSCSNFPVLRYCASKMHFRSLCRKSEVHQLQLLQDFCFRYLKNCKSAEKKEQCHALLSHPGTLFCSAPYSPDLAPSDYFLSLKWRRSSVVALLTVLIMSLRLWNSLWKPKSPTWIYLLSSLIFSLTNREKWTIWMIRLFTVSWLQSAQTNAS